MACRGYYLFRFFSHFISRVKEGPNKLMSREMICDIVYMCLLNKSYVFFAQSCIPVTALYGHENYNFMGFSNVDSQPGGRQANVSG